MAQNVTLVVIDLDYSRAEVNTDARHRPMKLC